MKEALCFSELILRAIEIGAFPMAESSQNTSVDWYRPKDRGVLFLKDFHASRSLRKVVRKKVFDVRFDTDFLGVIKGCANREETWINDTIIKAYETLFHQGFAHSVECWQEGCLVGGLYGVARGGLFVGESMFSLKTNASKVALYALVERLKASGFLLIDTQFQTQHLSGFGVKEIPDAIYIELITKALRLKAIF